MWGREGGGFAHWDVGVSCSLILFFVIGEALGEYLVAEVQLLKT